MFGEVHRLRSFANNTCERENLYSCMVIPDERKISRLPLIFQTVDNSVTEIRLLAALALETGSNQIRQELRLTVCLRLAMERISRGGYH